MSIMESNSTGSTFTFYPKAMLRWRFADKKHLLIEAILHVDIYLTVLVTT